MAVNKPAGKKKAASHKSHRHHLDRRAHLIAAQPGDDDKALSTREAADWLGVSEQFLEIGRCRGYGPPFERISPKVIRYRIGKMREWLASRTHTCTSEYV